MKYGKIAMPYVHHTLVEIETKTSSPSWKKRAKKTLTMSD
jgi:hypothetical protein